MDFGIITYGAIAAICYVLGIAMKTSVKVLDEYIPAILIVLGIVLGIVCYLIGVPDFPAQDPVNAAAIGGISAAAAIAANQIVKQSKKRKSTLENLSNNGGDGNE